MKISLEKKNQLVKSPIRENNEARTSTRLSFPAPSYANPTIYYGIKANYSTTRVYQDGSTDLQQESRRLESTRKPPTDPEHGKNDVLNGQQHMDQTPQRLGKCL